MFLRLFVYSTDRSRNSNSTTSAFDHSTIDRQWIELDSIVVYFDWQRSAATAGTWSVDTCQRFKFAIKWNHHRIHYRIDRLILITTISSISGRKICRRTRFTDRFLFSFNNQFFHRSQAGKRVSIVTVAYSMSIMLVDERHGRDRTAIVVVVTKLWIDKGEWFWLKCFWTVYFAQCKSATNVRETTTAVCYYQSADNCYYYWKWRYRFCSNLTISSL